MKKEHRKVPYQEIFLALCIRNSKALFPHLLLNINNLDKVFLECYAMLAGL